MYPIHGQTIIHIASAAEGREILGAADAWVKSLSPFDRKVRMEKNEGISEEAFLSFAADQAVDWDRDESECLAQCCDTIRQELEAANLNLELPEQVLLIKTTGKEEGRAAYTRQNAIMFPVIEPQHPPINGILHELFHIMTRHAPQIRKPLYEIIGYHPCSEVKLPESLIDRKITNPDAFHNNFFIEALVDDVPTDVIPVIYSNKERYDGGGLFDYLSFKLMAVEIVNDIYQPVLKMDFPVLLDVSEVTNFHEQIGGNTGYIIHPEETMADNFVYMMRKKSDLPNPEILDSLKSILSK